MIPAKWLIEQAILRVGGEENALCCFPTHIVRDLKEGKTFKDLPLDVLAHLLSFVERKDIYTVIKVCRLWYEAFKKPQFWKRHIDKALEKVIIDYEMEDNKQYQAAIRLFNTFYSPVTETLREQVEWIFKPFRGPSKWVCLFENHLLDGFIIMERRTHQFNCLGNWFYKSSLKLRQVNWYVCDDNSFDESKGRYCSRIFFLEDPGTTYCEFVDTPKYKEAGNGTFVHMSLELKFEGQLIFQEAAEDKSGPKKPVFNKTPGSRRFLVVPALL
ncbi:MAG: F-box protein [Nitrosomonas sp.]|nr:F-box protein [Nitrosomonas sp.]